MKRTNWIRFRSCMILGQTIGEYYSILVKFRASFADFRFKKRIKQLIRVPSHAWFICFPVLKVAYFRAFSPKTWNLTVAFLNVYGWRQIGMEIECLNGHSFKSELTSSFAISHYILVCEWGWSLKFSEWANKTRWNKNWNWNWKLFL